MIMSFNLFYFDDGDGKINLKLPGSEGSDWVGGVSHTAARVPKSHIHMVTVLANLSAGYDDSGPDEPLTFKQAMTSTYWKGL